MVTVSYRRWSSYFAARNNYFKFLFEGEHSCSSVILKEISQLYGLVASCLTLSDTSKHVWMDYLAGVLGFIFVDKVHQKESETDIQTLKHTHTHNIAIKAVFFHQYFGDFILV